MGFHTDIDTGSILATFTQSLPPSGGQQYLASLDTVVQKLAASDPEVVRTMMANWYWEKETR